MKVICKYCGTVIPDSQDHCYGCRITKTKNIILLKLVYRTLYALVVFSSIVGLGTIYEFIAHHMGTKQSLTVSIVTPVILIALLRILKRKTST